MRSTPSYRFRRRELRAAAATDDFVVVTKHGRPVVALLPAGEARAALLCAYTCGRMSRARVMQLLGFHWYGQLVDAMRAAGVKPVRDAAREAAMRAQVVQLLQDYVE
jgi:hypothetical protein